ncbi:putative conserved membrane protein [Mycobacterium kansasii]|uniref:Putative conserved membrane protein n=1 Tax=Mycobacterium kansasii TaxID=1768 RepID=A0A1V3WMP9_MYCKA|nr:putative conserved membrane protein [Mycobacterium kansasii]
MAYGLALLGLGVGAWSQPMLSSMVLVIWLLLGVIAVRLFGFTPASCSWVWWWWRSTAGCPWAWADW